MLKKISASVQLGVVRNEAAALVMRVTELSIHAILETFGREPLASHETRKNQPVRGPE
jgi:hypothetical protein